MSNPAGEYMEGSLLDRLIFNGSSAGIGNFAAMQ
tara:strand:+ start:16 stop:117 length:102 start_codon:yes stop_codon:yes gene_type:complete